jgi:hypothetical protein
VAEFCPYGCYWDCEHRASPLVEALDPAEALERARLRPVTDADTGQPLRRCRECGGYFYDAYSHSREHARMRQLGWLSHSDSLR